MSNHATVTNLVLTINPTAAIGAYLAVGLDGEVAGAGEPILGFTQVDVEAGKAGPLYFDGILIAYSGAAIDGTVLTLKTDANGKLIPTTATTDQVAAYLWTGGATANTATAADQEILVIPVHAPAAADT